MKKWFKVAMCALAICAFSCTFVGCTNEDGTDWLNQLTCEHEWDDGVVTKEATCTAEGTLTKTCEKCEKVKTEKAPKAEHDEELLMKTDATCDVDGEALYECKDCGAFRKEVLKAEGHKSLKVKGVAATCGEEGYTDYIVCETCDKVLTPSTIIPATGAHNYGEDGLCMVCQSPKAAEVLATYASATNVQETLAIAGSTYDAYTVIRVYRGDSGDEGVNAFYINEYTSSAFKFGAFDLNKKTDEFYYDFPFYIAYGTTPEKYGENGIYEYRVDGDFAYEVNENYIDFCFGNTINLMYSYSISGETTKSEVSGDLKDGFTLGGTFTGDATKIKILSLNV